MTFRYPTFSPNRLTVYVPNKKYDSKVNHTGPTLVEFLAISALSATAILNAQSINAAIDLSASGLVAGADAASGPFGRNVTVALSGAGTPAVVVYGYDWLGQAMSESFTGAGTTPVVGKKAFKRVTRVTSGLVSATTLNLGWGNALGLPFKAMKLLSVVLDEGAPTSDGTFVPGLISATPQTATTNDPRGTWTPNASDLPNGTRNYKLYLLADMENLDGNAHYTA